uniref:diamine acetyltransferase 1-like n=1 Tax=Doryrhamphus excisus TaxID=161450 RepID=UPI0025ADCEBE|nr:diamine acetyltransferase 1-like [Doryrhamphus excisus]
MSFTIRHATKADCKNIWRLIKELAVHEGKLQQVMQSYEDFEQDAYSQKPWFESLIAEVPKENKSQKGFTTVGLALYYYTYSTWKGRSVYLEDLYVMSEFRGFGIGKSLLNTLAKVSLYVNKVKFYIFMGTSATFRMMTKSISIIETRLSFR